MELEKKQKIKKPLIYTVSAVVLLVAISSFLVLNNNDEEVIYTNTTDITDIENISYIADINQTNQTLTLNETVEIEDNLTTNVTVNESNQ